MESSSSSTTAGEDPGSGQRLERGLSRNNSDSTVRTVSSRGVERGDSLHSLGSQLPAPKTTRPIQRSRWNSARNLSERSLLSTTSSILTAPIIEDEDEETMLLVEKLQNEEIMNRVLEQSVTETSGSNSLLSSNHQDISIPMFIHEQPPVTGGSTARRKQPPSFEASRSVDLSDELFELDPRQSPPPSRRRNPPDGASATRKPRRMEVEAEILDLRISNRSLLSDAESMPRQRLTNGRGISHPNGSSRSLYSISSQHSMGSHHSVNPPKPAIGMLPRSDQSVRSMRSESSRAIPSTVSSTPNTPQKSLPGAVSVPTPANVSKRPEVRAAIEKFVTQPVQDTADSPPILENVKCAQGSSDLKQEPAEQDVPEEPIVQYKYRRAGASEASATDGCDGLQTNGAGNGPAWKQVSSSESSYLGHGWPSLGPPGQQDAQDPKSQAKEMTANAYGYDHDLSAENDHLSPDELQQIEMALRESETMDCKPSATSDNETCQDPEDHGLSAEDSLAIADALRQAEEEENARREEDERRSLEVALLMQREEDERLNAERPASRPQHQGNVRTVSREEFARQRLQAEQSSCGDSGFDDHDADHDPEEFVSDGFRMNTTENQKWSRVNRDVVIGPDRQQRTKHDTMLNGKSNAYRLGLDEGLPSISNTAYNSFMKSTKSMTKGVASSGVGRAGRDAGGTKSGALDENVRLVASKAINRGFIDKMNGVVNEGKEAVVYHADPGPESLGFAVAVKAFKRIQEFRSRGEYVDGDPRYRTRFSDVGAREQLEIWAEKEYRNLVRANTAGIAVPFPLWTKENVVFMRFLGESSPCPQLRELDLHHGSKRWAKLYEMVIDSIERLYRDARLVHGDLSEYNILVAPTHYVKPDDSTEIIPVLIDFAQAVDVRHPEAHNYLARDVSQVLKFFSKVGVSVGDAQDIIDEILDL